MSKHLSSLDRDHAIPLFRLAFGLEPSGHISLQHDIGDGGGGWLEIEGVYEHPSRIRITIYYDGRCYASQIDRGIGPTPFPFDAFAVGRQLITWGYDVEGFIRWKKTAIPALEPADQPLTPDLMEAYGFEPDEPSIWFLPSPGLFEPVDLAVQIRQSLRHQDEWTLFIEGGGDKDDVQVELMGIEHLLATLKEHGYKLEDFDDDEEGGSDE